MPAGAGILEVESPVKQIIRTAIAIPVVLAFAVTGLPVEAGETLSEYYTTGAGSQIPIQREWSKKHDPADFEHMPMGEQPFRFDQRQPRLVHTEERPGKSPIYYFDDVRWTQDPANPEAPFARRCYWTTARVDLDKIKAAYFCMKPFAPKFVAGHAAILVEFEPGGFVNLDGEESKGFTLSYEAYLRVTQRYEMIGGQFQRKFRIIYVVGTWNDFLIRSLKVSKSVVKRWRLKLDGTQLRDLAVAIGKTVTQDHTKERYNTTRNSCVTAALDLINEAAPKAKLRKKWLFGLIQNPFWALPVLADETLRLHGLIDGKKETIREYSAQ